MRVKREKWGFYIIWFCNLYYVIGLYVKKKEKDIGGRQRQEEVEEGVVEVWDPKVEKWKR